MTIALISTNPRFSCTCAGMEQARACLEATADAVPPIWRHVPGLEVPHVWLFQACWCCGRTCC